MQERMLKFLPKTFRRGTHPAARKLTADMPLVLAEAPERMFFSLAQHIGAPAKPVVAPGDRVRAGDLLAEAGGFVSAPVHSSVSGVVKGIVTRPTPTGGRCRHIEVENDFAYETVSLPPLTDPDAEQIRQRVRDCGIVGMGGAAFPTHVKLAPSKPVDILVINGAECEPYITCDYRLMLEKTEELLRGVGYLMKALGVSRAIIGVEANKLPAIEKLRAAVGEGVEVVKLRTKYPQGAEKQLIAALTGRKVPPGGLPMDIGCVVDNIHTAYAVTRAVECGEPLYMRALTVSGNGVEKKGNYFVRTGTPFEFIYEMTRGDVPEDAVRKVINGGPMMGFAQADLSASVQKGTSSILFFDAKEAAATEPTQCINCGRCINHCPMNLMPRDMEREVINGDYKKVKDMGLANCMECGVCSYVCPAKRPLVQAFRLAKKTVKERGI